MGNIVFTVRRALVAALVTGVLCGLAARVLMRAVADVTAQVLSFTPQGTLGIMLAVVVLNLPAAFAFGRGWKSVGHVLAAAAWTPHVSEAVTVVRGIWWWPWTAGRYAYLAAVLVAYVLVLAAGWWGLYRLTAPARAGRKTEGGVAVPAAFSGLGRERSAG
ncbi:hypothetical protein EDD29_6617 [Actinocorallia herbida]|uniref:Uncharacterized protein n=1 Tax=Actinocorallia herbida TaxID=58109 RepID=A0A3N1D5V1_9ACTN|nr:hypothetical protein [Actinocorallia herbida]ROO88932.1 hypothetical protein EDD29_6617 [Actinocorallia herbida]